MHRYRHEQTIGLPAYVCLLSSPCSAAPKKAVPLQAVVHVIDEVLVPAADTFGAYEVS